MINIHLGENIPREDNKLSEHINIQISYHKFASLLRAPMTEREAFTDWIRGIYPKIGPTGKITIELMK